jgi:hypothetical protein
MKPGLLIFGIDDLSSGYATKLLPAEVEFICHFTDIPHLGTVEICPRDYDELVGMTNEIFESYKAKGWIVEGLVIRSLDSNNLSTKVMNNFYDSRK